MLNISCVRAINILSLESFIFFNLTDNQEVV